MHLQYESRGLMTENNNVYKTIIEENGIKKEYKKIHICCIFMISNTKNPRTYTCGRFVLCRKSDYFAISKLTL